MRPTVKEVSTNSPSISSSPNVKSKEFSLSPYYLPVRPSSKAQPSANQITGSPTVSSIPSIVPNSSPAITSTSKPVTHSPGTQSSGAKSPSVSPSASSVKLTMSPSGNSSSPPTAIPTLFATTPPTSYPSPVAIADVSPPNYLHSSQIEGSTGGKVASTTSRSPGASTAVLILSVIVAAVAVLMLYLHSTRRKKRIDRCIDNSYQSQQHLTLQASTTEIQGYRERINATTSDTNNGHASIEDDSHAASSPTDRSATSRTWDRDVNHHFAQHFSPRSLVDPSSSRVS